MNTVKITIGSGTSAVETEVVAMPDAPALDTHEGQVAVMRSWAQKMGYTTYQNRLSPR